MAKIYDITDFSAPELDVYARLTENQLVNRADPANALFIAESPLVIGRALDAGCVPVSFLMERRHIDGKARDILARCPADIPVYAAELDVPAKVDDDVSEEIRRLAVRAFTAIDCQGLARVDFFLTDDGPVINEINTMPGFTTISMFPRMWAASGVDYPTLLTAMVETALARGTGLR